MHRNANDVTYNREQIAAIQDRNEAINKAASQDGLYSLPELIAILQDIRKTTEDHIEIILKKITNNKPLEKFRSEHFDSGADSFVKYGEDIVPEFKVKAKQKLSSLTNDVINAFVQNAINSIIKKFPAEATKKENEEAMKLLLAYLNTEFYLLCALALYNDLDYKQNHQAETVAKEGWNAIKSWGKSKDAASKRDEIEAPFLLVQEVGKKMHVSPGTQLLWQQAERWLMGLHYRSYNLYTADQKDAQGNVKKNEAGEYVSVKGDVADNYLSNHGVCKYSLSFYHRRIAENIALILSAFKESPIETTLLSGKADTQSLFAPKNKEKQKEKAGTFLNRYKQASEDVQFSMMVDAIENCEVTEDDERRLKTYLDSRKKKVEAYRQAWFSTWWLPTLFVPRPHAALAKEAMNKIKDSEDVRYQLMTLYNLWVDTDGKGSKEIHPAVSEVLHGAFSILANGGELEVALLKS